ncbi:MAG: hypothetical protein ACXV7G_06565 [Halobacteriota archaeon]
MSAGLLQRTDFVGGAGGQPPSSKLIYALKRRYELNGGEKITQMLPQCFNCKHFHTGNKCDAYPTQRVYNCDAFPDPKREIPGDIFSNTVLNKTPYTGDNGILYDPIDPKVSY